MSTPYNNTDIAIREQAHYWYALHADRGLDDTMRAEFEQWRDASPEHALALVHAESVWERLDQGAVQQQISQAYDASQEQAAATADIVPIYEAARPRFPAFPSWAGQALAASLAFFALLGIAYYGDFLPGGFGDQAGSPAQTVYQTQSERKRIRLVDGSVISLDPSSQLLVYDFAQRRHVELLAGRARFDVARDADKPFTVAAAPARVEVLGTIFDIQREDDTAEIRVREGRVAVMREAERLELAAGQGIRVTTSGMARLARAAIPAAAPAPRAAKDGNIAYYTDASLADIIADANRYARVPVTVDSSVGQMTVSGAFPVSDTDRLIAQLEEILPITTERTSGGIRVVAEE
ncbi:MAG: FecR domain-containing protein [Pseudomonadota bacterium]